MKTELPTGSNQEPAPKAVSHFSRFVIKAEVAQRFAAQFPPYSSISAVTFDEWLEREGLINVPRIVDKSSRDWTRLLATRNRWRNWINMAVAKHPAFAGGRWRIALAKEINDLIRIDGVQAAVNNPSDYVVLPLHENPLHDIHLSTPRVLELIDQKLKQILQQSSSRFFRDYAAMIVQDFETATNMSATYTLRKLESIVAHSADRPQP